MSVESNNKTSGVVFYMSLFFLNFIFSSSSFYCILQKYHSMMDWELKKERGCYS